MFTDKRERPLLQPKRGAFFYTDFRSLGRTPESSEDRYVDAHMDRVIAPVPGGHHPSVKVEDSLDLETLERGNWAPVPGMRERRNDTQALFTLGWV